MSEYGLTFNSKNSYSDIGLTMKSDNRNLLPEMEKRELKIPGKHGTWDFGRNTYRKRQITVTFSYLAENRTDARIKARRIAQWINNPIASELWFDDEADKVYIARVYDPIDPDEIVNDLEFKVTFDCQPIADCKYLASEIILDTDIILDGTDIRLDDEYVFTVTNAMSFEVNNFGTFEVRPVISIYGSFTTFSININGKQLNYNEAISNATVEIDNENYTIEKGAVNKIGICTGALNTFLDLQPGINTIAVDGSNLNCTVSFIFKPKYL